MSNEVNKSIGGYFSLELPLSRNEYHQNAIKVNSGKNAFEYILASYDFKISKVYLPYFTSRIMVKPLIDHGIPFQFYKINELLEIEDDIFLHKDEFVVYTNYFGLKGEYINSIAGKYGKQLIVDNAQAFYDKPLSSVNTFYSPRKFFGVLDGGYAYTHGKEIVELKDSISYDRMGYLLKRIDTSAEEAYGDYKSSCHLGGLPVQKMSKLTQSILGSVDYNAVANVRRNNFLRLEEALHDTNKLYLPIGNAVPLVYPYLTDEEELRARLVSNKIYVAQYWPNVFEWCEKNALEHYFATHIMPLPIDQRYEKEDMKRIISIIKQN